MDELATKIRDAIDASDLYTDSGISVQVEPRMLINPTEPSIDIYPADPFGVQDTQGFGGQDPLLNFVVRARISTADQDAGQDMLLSFMDPEDPLSVAVALDDDQTLNGLAGSVYVTGPSGYTLFLDASGNGQGLLGCTWLVSVLNAKS